MEEKEISFEQAEKELEAITAKLEEGKVSLSEAAKLYERGALLVQICARQIEKAKGQITVIKENTEKLFQSVEE